MRSVTWFGRQYVAGDGSRRTTLNDIQSSSGEFLIFIPAPETWVQEPRPRGYNNTPWQFSERINRSRVERHSSDSVLARCKSANSYQPENLGNKPSKDGKNVLTTTPKFGEWKGKSLAKIRRKSMTEDIHVKVF